MNCDCEGSESHPVWANLVCWIESWKPVCLCAWGMCMQLVCVCLMLADFG